jgi:predicted lipoprotein with Yx(FWY)xxD motif
MRKSGWTAATGLGSLVLLLAACGGSSSSSNSASGAGSNTAPSSSSGSGSGAASQATAQATATKKARSSSSPTPSRSHQSVGAQPSSGAVVFPPQGTTVLIVQKSNIGYVLSEASGLVVYTYKKDTKGGAPTCTGSCATTWPPVTGVPKAGPADTFPGSFGVVKGAGGVEQITYNGYPLYLYAGAKPYTTSGNGIGGEWHVVPLSESDISA